MEKLKNVWANIKKNKAVIIVVIIAVTVLACTFFFTPFADKDNNQNINGSQTSELFAAEKNSDSQNDTAEPTSLKESDIPTEENGTSQSAEKSTSQTYLKTPAAKSPDTTKVSETTKSPDTTNVTVTRAPDTTAVTTKAPETTTVPQKQMTCTLSISCAVILNNMDKLDKSKVSLVPADGWILNPVSVTFKEGESVYDVVRRYCNSNRIHFESSFTPLYNSSYIEGIGNLYEFDCGPASGWMYNVNGIFPNYSSSKYTLSDSDVIKLLYTCNLGVDIGGGKVIG